MATYGYDETTAPPAIQNFSNCTYGYEELLSAYPTRSLHACVPLPHPHEQVRLLELDPVYSRDPNTAPALHGRLRLVNLREQQEYSALSYVWGQEDPGTSQRNNRLVIHCDGHQHEARIGPNCWSALWHITKARGALTVWVDSVCIDQRNSEEKGHQIPLMQAIYKSAHTTYFWLGEAAPGTDEAIKYLSTSVLSISNGTASDIVKAGFTLFLRRHTLQVRPHQSALDNIFKRPWIERLWTLQEAVLSHNSTVVCGETSIPWEDLICALESIHFFRTKTYVLGFEDSYMAWLNLANISRWFADSNSEHSRRQDLVGQSSDRFGALDRKVHGQRICLKWAGHVCIGLCLLFFSSPAFYFFCFFIPQSVIPTHSPKLFSLLLCVPASCTYLWLLNTSAIRMNRKLGLRTNFYMKSHLIIQELRTRKATDPQDMYFGTLGILSDDSLAAPGSLLVLYKRLCASLIQRTRSLDILIFANADTKKKFPSWVIDWRLETPHIWNTPLHWIHTWGPNQTGCAQQDSVFMHSAFWMRLYNVYKQPAFTAFSRRFLVFTDSRNIRWIRRYRGASPKSNLFWEFRNQGEHLCVHGLVITEILSRFVPIPTENNTMEAQSALQVLTASRELTRGHHIDQIEVSNATLEATFRQSEVCMLASLLYGALSDMTETDRLKTVDRSNKLIDVLTDNRNSARLLWMWWRRLLLSTANDQGTLWVETFLAEDKPLKDRLNAFMESLGAGGLNVFRCQRTELCTGGLGFASAAVQEGDSVALVSGVSYPLILRPCGQQHFKLIGPIFLPLVMDGELMEVVRPESMGEIILV